MTDSFLDYRQALEKLREEFKADSASLAHSEVKLNILNSIVLMFKVLKVICNAKEGGSGKWQTSAIDFGPWRSRFVCL